MDWTVRPHGYVSPPPAPPSPDRASASGSSGSPDSVDAFEGVEMGVAEVAKPEVETSELVKLEPTELEQSMSAMNPVGSLTAMTPMNPMSSLTPMTPLETNTPSFNFDAFSAKSVPSGFYGSEKKDDCSRDLVGG